METITFPRVEVIVETPKVKDGKKEFRRGIRLYPQFRFLVALLTYPEDEFTVKEFAEASLIKNKMTAYRYLRQAEQLHMIRKIYHRGSWYRKRSTEKRKSVVGGGFHKEMKYRKCFKLIVRD